MYPLYRLSVYHSKDVLKASCRLINSLNTSSSFLCQFSIQRQCSRYIIVCILLLQACLIYTSSSGLMIPHNILSLLQVLLMNIGFRLTFQYILPVHVPLLLNISFNGTSTLNSLCILETSLVAFNECPPNSKKLSFMPIFSIPSISFHMATAFLRYHSWDLHNLW